MKTGTVPRSLSTALELLHDRAPSDLKELTFALGAEMMRLAGLVKTDAQARARMPAAIESGAARGCMRAVVAAQGGDARVVDEPDRLPRARARVNVTATKAGFVHGIDALEVGLTGVAMGAGRTRADQHVDPTVGIVLHKTRGERVAKGDLLAELHVNDETGTEAFASRIAAAYELEAKPPPVQRLVLDVIRK